MTDKFFKIKASLKEDKSNNRKFKKIFKIQKRIYQFIKMKIKKK